MRGDLIQFARHAVGRPYSDERNCWGLVRDALAVRGVDLPPVSTDSPAEALLALRAAIRVNGMRRARGAPAEGDLVVMRSPARTHVGVALRANGRMCLLHSTSAAGGVICEVFADAARGTEVELWRRTPGAEGEEPEWETLPQDRDAARSVLLVAAIIAVQWIAPGLGLSEVGALAFKVGATIAATAAINALLPPVQGAIAGGAPGQTGTAMITSIAGNVARLDQPIWRVCGWREITPPYAGQPYYEFRPRAGATDEDLDQDQYFCALFAIGIGAYEVRSAKIGNTPVSRFSDVVVAQYLAPGVAPSYVEPNVVTALEVGGLRMETARFTAAYPACAPNRTAADIAVDMLAPRGLGKGSGSLSVRWIVQCRTIDDIGRPLGAWFQLGPEYTRTATTATPQRWSVRETLPTPARVEVRVVRTDTEDQSPTALHELQWGGLRAYLAEPAPLNAAASHYEIVLRATGQLNDNSTRQLRLIIEGIARGIDVIGEVPAFTAEATTRNPACWLADLLTNAAWGLGRSSEQIDLQALYDLRVKCDERQDRFDFVFDSTMNAWDAAQLIARSARSRIFRRNGLISVARDEWVDVPVTLFSHRNSLPGIAIGESLRTRSVPDGVIVEYQDNRSWEWLEILCPCPGVDAENVANPVRKRYEGITGRTHAEREGRYDAAAMLYRARTISWTTEMQGVLLSYMSAVEIIPDVQGYGSSGDVVDWVASDLALTLSEPASFETVPLTIRLLGPDGVPTEPIEVDPGSGAREVILTEPLPSGFEIVTSDAGMERTKYLLGARELVKVLSIADGGQQDGAQLYTIEGVIDDARVHAADTALLPGPGDVQDPVAVPEDLDDDPTYTPDGIIISVTARTLSLTVGNTTDVLRYRVRFDGSIGANYFTGDGPDLINGDSIIADEWIIGSPVETYVADNYEARFVYISEMEGITGAPTITVSPGWDTWENASASPWVGVANTGTVIFRVEIRDVATLTTQATATITLVRGYSEPP